MQSQSTISSSIAAALVVALGTLFVPGGAHAQAISQTTQAGSYTVTLKVLPPEGFSGSDAPMVADSGAAPNAVNGPEHPNHHLVAFVTKDGKPVEHADVTISYRQAPSTMGSMSKSDDWTRLDVVRMHVAGKDLDTTHYGNNVHLASGKYEVRVSVNGSAPAVFEVSV
jgi:hypothetical protein